MTQENCMDCGREYAVWFAPSDLWNRAMRDAGGHEETPYICATCFTLAAEKAGVVTAAWMVTTEAGGPVRHASQVQVAPAEEKPNGWPESCRSCGAPWTQIGFDYADGFNCRSCGGADSDEVAPPEEQP